MAAWFAFLFGACCGSALMWAGMTWAGEGWVELLRRKGLIE
jgi:hypothetical protein